MSDQILVRSNVKHTVGIINRDFRINKSWEKKGTVRPFDREVLKDLMFEPGVMQLFTDGYLVVDNLEDKIYLGLEPEGATESVNIIILTDEQKENLLRNKPLFDFKNAVANYSFNQFCELVNFAIEKQIMLNYDKNKFIKDTIGKDVNKSIENINLAKEV